jgi:FkbM family methyltransferase
MRARELVSTLARPKHKIFWDETLESAEGLLGVLDLAPDTRARADVLRAWVALTGRRAFRLRGRSTRPIRFRGPSGVLTAGVADRSELLVIDEVFAKREYELREVEDARTVVDLGANAGMSVLWFKARFPAARVIAVEPHPETFARLQANTGHLDGVELVQAAVSDRDGSLELHVGADSWGAGMHAARGTTGTISVRALTLDRLLDEHGLDEVDVLKVDIEGAEVGVLRTTRALDRVRTMVFEFHQEHTDVRLRDLLDELEGFDVVAFKGDSAGHPLVTLQRR